MPTDVVCFFNAFMAPHYGDFYVIFRKDDIPMAYPANPPEWRYNGVVNQDAIGYTTTDELRQAGLI